MHGAYLHRMHKAAGDAALAARLLAAIDGDRDGLIDRADMRAVRLTNVTNRHTGAAW